MLGLIKDFAITSLIIILNHWVYDVEDIIAYDFIVNFITKNHTLFLSTGIFGSAGLLIFTLIEDLGLYKITYGLSKLFVRICQFFITFLCTINILFYLAMGMNLMQDSAYFLLFVLILIIGSSCWALRLIDFNHPTSDVLMPIGVIAFMSVILVEFIWPLVGI